MAALCTRCCVGPPLIRDGGPGQERLKMSRNFHIFSLTRKIACTNLAKISQFFWEGAMVKNKYLAISALGFFLTGCAGMSKNQAALVVAASCVAGGAAGGAVVAHHGL